MKKLLAVFLCAAVLTLTACSDNKETSNKDKDKSSVSDNKGGPADNLFQNDNGGDDIELSENKWEPKDIWDVLPEIDVTPAEEFEYEYSRGGDGIYVTNYLGESTAIRIPDEFEGKPVVYIGLRDCDKEFTEIIMPDTTMSYDLPTETLQYMNIPRDSWRFRLDRSKESLKAVYIADGAIEIADAAFARCTSLTNIYP